MKPTVIGGGKPDEPEAEKPAAAPAPSTLPKPTALPTTVVQPPQAQAAKPSVMPSAMSAAKPPTQQPTSRPSAPTLVQGTQRVRIPVTIAQLQYANIGVKDSVLEAAKTMIEQFNVDTATDSTVVLWGNDIQQAYAALVQECLTLSQDKKLDKVRGYVNRMIEVLSLIDLARVCGLAKAHGTGLFGGLFTSNEQKKIVDTPEELEHAQKELGQLTQKMSDQLATLLAVKAEFERVSNAIDAAGDKAEAAAVAAQFLAEHIKSSVPAKHDLIQRLLTRSASLLQTTVQIRGSDAVRKVQIEQPLQLIEAVQKVANVSMPAWLNNIVMLTTMLRQKRKPTATEVGEIGGETQALIEDLKGQ